MTSLHNPDPILTPFIANIWMELWNESAAHNGHPAHREAILVAVSQAVRA
jgi:hypothetical protein